MKKLIFAGITGLASVVVPPSVYADVVGVYVGGNYWDVDADGSIASANEQAADFDFEQEGQNSLYIAIEHPVPLLPNLKIRQNDLDSEGTANVTGFEFNNVTFNGSVATQLDLSHTDFIMYYELADNVISFDLGLNVKYFDGSAQVSSTTDTTRVDLSTPLPMAYIALGGSLPFTGLSAKAEASVLSFKDSEVADFQAELKYDFVDNVAVDLGLTLGYRRMSLKLDDVDDIDTDLTFSGPYIGLEAHF